MRDADLTRRYSGLGFRAIFRTGNSTRLSFASPPLEVARFWFAPFNAQLGQTSESQNVNAQFIEDQLAADVTTPSDNHEEHPHDPAGLSAFLPTPDAMEVEIASVMEIKLNGNLQPWVEGYSKVGHRNPFLWNWCRRGVEVTMLSCVEPSLQDAVCDTRVLGIMLDVLLDDIADHLKDLAFLEQLLGVMETGVRPAVSALLAPSAGLCHVYTGRLGGDPAAILQFPRYQEFAELLRFDYRQLFNVMRYSRLLNEYPEMFNLVEHDLYTPHNMHMMISATMDLMCSPAFDRAELAHPATKSSGGPNAWAGSATW